MSTNKYLFDPVLSEYQDINIYTINPNKNDIIPDFFTTYPPITTNTHIVYS